MGGSRASSKALITHPLPNYGTRQACTAHSDPSLVRHGPGPCIPSRCPTVGTSVVPLVPLVPLVRCLGARELPSCLAGSNLAMRFSLPGVLPSSGESTSQQWRQLMPISHVGKSLSYWLRTWWSRSLQPMTGSSGSLRGQEGCNPPPPATPPPPPYTCLGPVSSTQSTTAGPIRAFADKFLSMKTLLLLVLASIKRVGDLHTFSVDDSCLEFGPADSQIILKPQPSYVPKVPTTPFRDHVVSLQVLFLFLQYIVCRLTRPDRS